MFGENSETSKNENEIERRKSALNKAHDIRKFEIELYWNCTLYFWGFQIALITAFGLTANRNKRI